MSKRYRFSKSSKIGDVLNDPDGFKVFTKYVPILIYNPIIKFGSNYPLWVIRFVKFDNNLKLSGSLSRKIIKEVCKIEK